MVNGLGVIVFFFWYYPVITWWYVSAPLIIVLLLMACSSKIARRSRISAFLIAAFLAVPFIDHGTQAVMTDIALGKYEAEQLSTRDSGQAINR
jgi:hypothetical protein